MSTDDRRLVPVPVLVNFAAMPRTSFRILFLLALGCLTARPLGAQNLLYTEHEGQMHLVRGARGIQPLMKINDKLVAGFGRKFILQKTDAYLPLTIFLHDMDVHSSGLNINHSDTVNHSFRFRAMFDSPFELPNVFLVLELDTRKDGKRIFLQEVGNLAPHESRLVEVGIPLAEAIGPTHYHIHVFSDGEELLHSEMSAEYRDRVLDELTAQRVATVRNGGPKLFVNAVPEYPEALKKAHIAGQAIIALRIGTDGRVHDPAVKSASDPAFGQAALASMRLSRFLPRMQDGHAVEATVEVPVEFAAPEKKT